jgi:DNA (cytosine-5)-methyltransferase 1
MDLGLEAAGFEHVGLVEHNRLFCDTLRHNRSAWPVIGPPSETGDVSSRAEILDVLRLRCGLASPFDGLIVGGPPCQPFSIASNQRFSKSGRNFKRIGFDHLENGNLLFDMLWFISVLRPAAFLIENVEGLFDLDEGQQLQEALKDLSGWGYTVAEPFVLDAAHYRVPQHRRRLFICGSRLDKQFAPPRPSYDLVQCDAALRVSLDGVKNHEPRAHKPESLLRYMRLGYGQRDALGRVDRLDPCAPSKTVIAGGTKGGGRSHLHPHIPRTMTARESARLQTFPDDYEFLGPSARQFTQVGNAVPPVLAAQLGRAIYHSFFESRR